MENLPVAPNDDVTATIAEPSIAEPASAEPIFSSVSPPLDPLPTALTATDADLQAGLTCVVPMSQATTATPAQTQVLAVVRRWLSQRTLPNWPLSHLAWFKHPGLIGSSIAIATGLSFWAGIAVSASGLSLVPAMTMPYPRVPGTLGRLPTLADAAWQTQQATLNAAKQQLDFQVPTAFRGKTIEAIQLPSNKKVIALTFDDGPSVEFSNNVLYILDKYNIKATFFLLGRNVQKYPERAKQMYEQGHALANHSWSHPYHNQTPERAAAELNNTSVWIEKATGVKSKFFRPPGGFLHNGMADYAMQQGQTVVMWSADSKDYYASSAKIIQNVIKQASPGGIILLHDGGGDRTTTVAALPKIIETLLQQGYTFVTLPELMELYEQETQG
ncbi:MAG: polysaccharide deacetylase family protein [Cyanobacteria bacterium P01_G01_bin.54]